MSAPNYKQLTQTISAHLAPLHKSQPGVMKGFSDMGKAAMAAGALDAKTKELIALAVGVAARCDGCIGFHVKALVQLGCTRAELEEMLSVCVYMGGGPALMYAAEAIAAWEKMAPQDLHARV